MSSISDSIQTKCLAFADRVIKLNYYLLNEAAKKHHPSNIIHHTSRVPVHLQSVAAIANQLLRSGTSIGANNAEACNAISKADFKVGDIFTPGYCLTCSSDQTWQDKEENRYKIQPLNAENTKARSLYSVRDISEKQVTFLQDASFSITAINDWGEGKKEFEMLELS